MRKIIAFIALAFFLFSRSTWAEDPSNKVSIRIQPKYVADNGLLFYGKAVSVTDIYLRLKTGFYADFWNLQGFKGDRLASRSQITAGFSGSLKEDYGIGINAGLTYIEAPPLFNASTEDFWSPFFEISKKMEGGLIPYLRLDLIFPVQGKMEIAENRCRGGVRFVWRTGKKGLVLAQRLDTIYDDFAGAGASVVLNHDANLSWNLSKSMSLNLANAVFFPLKKVGAGHKLEIVPAIGLTYRF